MIVSLKTGGTQSRVRSIYYLCFHTVFQPKTSSREHLKSVQFQKVPVGGIPPEPL